MFQAKYKDTRMALTETVHRKTPVMKSLVDEVLGFQPVILLKKMRHKCFRATFKNTFFIDVPLR